MKNSKKTSLIALLFGLFLICQTSVSAQTTQITTGELPAKAQVFLKSHFPNIATEYIIKESEFMSTDYEVKLSEGTKIDFNSKGEWTDVECRTGSVPAKVIPAKISSYITKNNPGKAVVQIDRDSKGYDVKLSNGLELKFNSKQKFVGLDD